MGVDVSKFLDRAEEMVHSCASCVPPAENPGVVKAAQARGDFQVLVERERRVPRVHLGADVQAGLATLHEVMAQALA